PHARPRRVRVVPTRGCRDQGCSGPRPRERERLSAEGQHGRGLMFSAALEMVLNVALREALQRRHGHLTLEHLLYAVANHPAGEEILRACAVDLDKLRGELARFLEDSVER